jgi:hypothetical protein
MPCDTGCKTHTSTATQLPAISTPAYRQTTRICELQKVWQRQHIATCIHATASRARGPCQTRPTNQSAHRVADSAVSCCGAVADYDMTTIRRPPTDSTSQARHRTALSTGSASAQHKQQCHPLTVIKHPRPCCASPLTNSIAPLPIPPLPCSGGSLSCQSRHCCQMLLPLPVA